jgi:hypothetical protein
LSSSFHPSRAAKACAQSAILLLVEGEFERLCRESEALFVKFIVLSPCPFVRAAGMRVARESGVDVVSYIQKDIPLFIRQVLAMGKPFVADGYRLLKENGLEHLLLEDATFVELVLGSRDNAIVAAGISFVVRNGLLPSLVAAYGSQIINWALTPMHNPLVSMLLCELLRSDEISGILQERYLSDFDELAEQILSGPSDGMQLRALLSLARSFGRCNSDSGLSIDDVSFTSTFSADDLEVRAIAALRKQSPPLIFFEPAPISLMPFVLSPEEFKQSDDLYMFEVVAQQLLESIESPFFPRSREIENLLDYIRRYGLKENDPYIAAARSSLERFWEQHLHEMEEYIADHAYDISALVAVVPYLPIWLELDARDRIVKAIGSVYLKASNFMELGSRFHLSADMFARREFFPFVAWFSAVYSSPEMLAFTLLTKYPDAADPDATNPVASFDPRNPDEQLACVCDAGLSMGTAFGWRIRRIVMDTIIAGLGVPFCVALVASRDREQRAAGYHRIMQVRGFKQDARHDNTEARKQVHCYLKQPEVFYFFVHAVLNSADIGVRNDGVAFLRGLGIPYVWVDDVIYALQPCEPPPRRSGEEDGEDTD